MAAPARSAHDTIHARFTSPFPAIVHVELTNECNLDCPMCARTTSMTRPVQHMPDTMFRRVVVWLPVAIETQRRRLRQLVDGGRELQQDAAPGWVEGIDGEAGAALDALQVLA